MYGERGLKAFEVKRSSRVRSEDLGSLEAFMEDYPVAEPFLIYGGSRDYFEGKIRIVPIETFLDEAPDLLARSR